MVKHLPPGAAPAEAEDVITLHEDGAAAVVADDAVPLLDEAADDDAESLPKHAVQHPDGSITLPLKHECKLVYRIARSGAITEELIEKLTFHRLTGADMRALASVGKEALTATLFARSTRIAPGKMNLIFDRMDARDANFAQRTVARFL